MRSEDFEYLYNIEESFWWFVAMRTITDTIVSRQLSDSTTRRRILDAGCGTGFNLKYYSARSGNDLYGIDIASGAVEGVRKRGFQSIAQASVSEIPFKSGTFDMVFSFDVMCQVPSELIDKGLREMYRVLKPGGYLFIRVPAFEWMRSSHDVELQTTHRFSKSELAERLAQAGFRIQRATYANTLLFPLLVLRRLIKFVGIGRGTDTKPLPRGLRWMDPVLRQVLLSEALVLRMGAQLPIGLSAICYAQKLT